MIVTRFSQLIQSYHELGPGDVFVGRVPKSHLKATLLADLTGRGVRLLPSATAQLLNGSKVAQAFVLAPWMVPHTISITRRKTLLDALTQYHRAGITTAITKTDHLHCGHGVCKWNDLETLYSCLAHSREAFPFVLQPFERVATDIRVVIVDDYCESYSRSNPHSFRMNLASGGKSQLHELTSDQRSLCTQLLERAQMPYAHIDLMVTDKGAVYFSEIHLDAGTRGAQMNHRELNQMKRDYLMQLARQSSEAIGTDIAPK